MKLKEKVAIVTGGSRGIGKCIAKNLLREGVIVVICARNEDEINRTVFELKKMKSEVVGIQTDVSNQEMVKEMVEKVVESYGTIDILINCAGIQSPIGPLIEIDPDEWIKNIQINLIGTMLCCKYVLPQMIKKKWGRIINFSGGGAVFPRPNFSAYASAKAAVVRFTETLAEELKPFGITVNAVAPGAVNTRMLDEIIQAGEKAGEKEQREALKRKKEGGVSPERVARLVTFLASDEAKDITGKLISAVWDKWEDFNKNIETIKDTSIFTLRRIDGRRFIEKI